MALFGGAGLIGAAVADRALADGHGVRALARPGSPIAPRSGLVVVRGDARDRGAVAETLRGADLAVNAIGPQRNERAAVEAHLAAVRVIIDAMTAAGVDRLLFVAGAAVAMPGDQRPLQHRLATALVQRIVPHVVEAKTRELAIVRTSGLEWVAFRPARVMAGAGTRGARLDFERPGGLRVRAADLAAVIVASIDRDDLVGTAPFVWG